MLDACVRAAGRSWWGKADLAGGRVQGAGGELSRTHVCERMPSYLIRTLREGVEDVECRAL